MAQVDELIREKITGVVAEGTPGSHGGTIVRVALTNDSLLATGFGREMQENDSESPSRYDNPPHVPGKEQTGWGPLKWQWRGIPSASRLTAAGSADPLSDEHLWEHGFGRRYAAVGTTISGTSSTTTTADLASATGRKPGELIAVETTSGVFEVRSIRSLASTTATVSPAFGTAPTTNGRIVRGVRTFVLPETRNKHLTIEQKLIGTAQEFRCLGAMGILKLNFPAVGVPPTAELQGEAADVQGPTTLSSPSWSLGTDPADSDMDQPLVWMPRLFINGTEARFEPGSLKIEIAQKPDPVPNGAKASGVGSYLDTAGREGGVIVTGEFQIRWDTGEVTSFDNTSVQIRHLLLVCDPNNGLATTTMAVIEIPRFQVINRPNPISLGSGRKGMTVRFKGLKDNVTPASSSAEDTDLARSPIRFGLV